eukprot:TRINITY_DN43002_c0_g1_i1.p1 TRINITY_DN43002_c0_g1~~TRINITY_DN43002_c0_g1_i1.p1  ORF type:complete len:268 (+),score=86.23 TRINITY_DN43002_c0_g1_i1:79-804(+)
MPLLCVFDFDHTVVDDNTDTWVFQQLDPEVNREMESLAHKRQWTELMDHCLGRLAERGHTVADIDAVQRRIPFPEESVQTLRALRSAPSADIRVWVVSDSNTRYIDQILRHRAADCMPLHGVVTNPAWTEGDGRRLRVKPLCDAASGTAHGCKRCPPNLCKAEALDRIIALERPRQTIYVGDGGNDWCPALRLGEGDALLVRTGYRLERRVRERRGELRCAVHWWASHADLRRLCAEVAGV